jgi:hypothetical protein
MAKKDQDYGVGEQADGTVDVFPAADLAQRMAELRAMEKAATEPDDLSDLDEIEDLFVEDDDGEAEDAWDPGKHPRGQPENAGEFGPGGSAGSKSTGNGGGLGKWFGKSEVADAEGRPRVVYKAMRGDTPHMNDGLTHVALRREVAEAFAEKGKPVRRVYVKAENPFDYRDDADRGWLIKEMSKKKNIDLFNKQTNEMMGPDYDWTADADYIAAGIEDGEYPVFEIPMVVDLIKRRGYDGIYMAESGEGHREPNLAVFDPGQVRPVASFAKDEAMAFGCAGDEWDAALAADAEWNETDHPRGQPANAGQFSSSGRGAKSGGKGVGPDPKTDLSRGLNKDLAAQPVKSLDELYEGARKAEPGFKSAVEGAAAAVGAGVLYTPAEFAEPGTTLKSRKSAERKVRDELGGDPSLVRDVMRATIIGKTVADARASAAKFIGDHGDAVLRVKDRYNKPVNGYRDILVNYRTPEGLVAEVQFGSEQMLKAKLGDGHALYERMREIKPGSSLGPGPGADEVAKLEALSTEIYERAYQADGDGKWAH